MNEIALAADILRFPWVPGPCVATQQRVLVSLTDFQAASAEDLQEIAALGARLGQTWPVMQGAVGLWLWGKPTGLRGGSLSIWEGPADLRRFVSWSVHADIVAKWRGRITVVSRSWEACPFNPVEAWARAEEIIARPHGD